MSPCVAWREARALRARMVVAREETEEAKRAMKELIERLGNFTPSVFQARFQRMHLIFSELLKDFSGF